MGNVFETIDTEMADWIAQQQLFFVSTAPLSDRGLINCSPKGLDSFRILDPTTIGYADLTGSGIETAAHLRENGRIVIMFCAFKGPPKIVRFYGQGTYHDFKSKKFEELLPRFENLPGLRGIVEIRVTRIADSCGYGVPKFDFVGPRDTLPKLTIQKGEQGMNEYRVKKNAFSLDGLPGLDP